MLFKKYVLQGTCKRDFNTEIKYNIASGKVEGAELVSLSLTLTDEEKENSRLKTCVTKILSSMKKGATVQFFVKEDAFEAHSTEADYILNKYSEFILPDEGQFQFYVKLP